MKRKEYDSEINTGLKPSIRTRRKGWPPYYFAKLMINTLAPHVTSGIKYRKWIKETNSTFMPLHPERIYADFTWNAFLNTNNESPFDMVARVRCTKVPARDMWEAIKWTQQYCHENLITTQHQWQKQYDDEKIPKDIPKNPHIDYGKDFPGYPVWVGKKTISIVDAQTNVNGVLTLLHVTGNPPNVVNIKVWTNGLSDLRNNWNKQTEYDKVYGTWKYERERMQWVDQTLANLGHNRDGYWIIPNMNALLWELNTELMIVR